MVMLKPFRPNSGFNVFIFCNWNQIQHRNLIIHFRKNHPHLDQWCYHRALQQVLCNISCLSSPIFWHSWCLACRRLICWLLLGFSKPPAPESTLIWGQQMVHFCHPSSHNWWLLCYSLVIHPCLRPWETLVEIPCCFEESNAHSHLGSWVFLRLGHAQYFRWISTDFRRWH